MIKLLNEQTKELYILDINDIQIESLKVLLNKYGYEIVTINSTNELIENLVNKEKNEDFKHTRRNENSEIHFLEENIENAELRSYFHNLKYTIHWLGNVLDQFSIGFSIFNVHRHVLFNSSFMDYIYLDSSNYKKFRVGDTLILEDRKKFKKEINQLLKGKKEHAKMEIHSVTGESKKITRLIFNGFLTNIEDYDFIVGYFTLYNEQRNTYNEIMIHELHYLVNHLLNIHNLKVKGNNLPYNLSDKKQIEKLTKREKEILELIYNGFTNQQISSKLNISKRTVETHRANILNKTNSHNTADLIRYSIEYNLFG
jgi:DNA-binding CsgD family transcriptional regulator